jgi:hypothetical protein
MEENAFRAFWISLCIRGKSSTTPESINDLILRFTYFSSFADIERVRLTS